MMVGLGMPEAEQVNLAVLGDVITCDEGCSVMFTAAVIRGNNISVVE